MKTETTKEDMIKALIEYLIEYEFQNMTVQELIYFCRQKMREEFDEMSHFEIKELYDRYL